MLRVFCQFSTLFFKFASSLVCVTRSTVFSHAVLRQLRANVIKYYAFKVTGLNETLTARQLMDNTYTAINSLNLHQPS